MSKKPEFTPREQEVIKAVDNNDILGANLASLDQTRLTHAQNVELGEEIQKGLATSRKRLKIKPKIDELALGNAGLVIKLTLDLASQAQLTERDKADCLQNGLISLLAAAKKYKPRREAEFSSYAVPCILGGLRKTEPEFQTITLPGGMAGRARRYQREQALREQFRLPLDHMEISEIVAKEDGLKANPEDMPTIAKNLQLALNARKVVSLDEPCRIMVETGHTGELIQIEVDRKELLPDQAPDIEEIFANKNELKKEVHRALESLTDREREVLKLRFGLQDGLDHTREEVGHHFRSTAERIRLIEDKALKKLRHPARSGSLREYLSVQKNQT